MNVEQFLLGKIAEEAGEIAKEALKAQQFGLESYHPDDPARVTNRERLISELNDLLAVVTMLEPNIHDLIQPGNYAQRDKVLKVNRYLRLSQELGRTTC